MIFARASVARWLEAGGPRGVALEILGRVWSRASARRVSRPLSFAQGIHVIGVGGPTLGGSSKTPLALALTMALAERGERVAFVGHAYRARPRTARIVLPEDDFRVVGDEALLAARSLAPFDVDVVVAPTRQGAVDLAARRSRLIVIDGLLQAEPERIGRSLLTMDDHAPWGSGKCPPAGDLRAPREALLAAADAVVVVRDAIDPDVAALAEPTVAPSRSMAAVGTSRPTSIAHASMRRALAPDGSSTPLSDLWGTRFGLLLAIARPGRVVRSLALQGLHPIAAIGLGDHDWARPAELEREASRKQRVKLWLTTPKCALKLPREVAGAPVLALDRRVEVPKTLVDWVLSKGPVSTGFCPLGS